MVFGRIVEVKPITTDRYGRSISWIYFDGACLNEELLKAGLAWHYKRYSKAGLWRDTYPVPPWDLRHGKRVTKQKLSTDQDIVYHGNVKSKKFHRPSCRYYNCKNCTAIFHSREEAIRSGYEPCGLCKP
jgi:micrococcal nuclease